MHKSRKLIAILATLALLATLLVPMVGPAAAATTYSALTTPTVVPPATNTGLGTILISVDTLGAGTHKALFSLPTDFDRGTPTVSVAAYQGGPVSANLVTTGYQNNEFRLEVVASGVATDVKITVALPDVDVPSTASGDITCTITGLSGQLSSGSVVVGKASSGQLDIAAVDVPSITSTGTTGGKVQITVKENAAGALKQTASSLKFTLPNGFEWKDGATITDLATGTVASGVTVAKDVYDARKLVVNATSEDNTKKNIYRINADIKVNESDAKFGDVVATIGGDSSSNASEITVAKYVDFGVKVTGKSTETVLAGRTDQEIGDFYIEEDAPGSLIGRRTITLKLPANAKWVTNPTVDVEKGNVGLGSWESVDSRTIKATVTASTSASKILFKDAKVKLAVDTAGDLAIEVGGSAGATGSVVVAKVLAPVTVSATSTPDVKIGEQNQAAGDIVIVEAKKEAIDKVADATDLTITAPTGVTFAVVPTVTVTEGDLQIDKVTKADNVVNIEIKGVSSKASTIKVSDIKFTIDRTVPVGPVELKISGAGVNKTSADFANATVAAKVVNANVVTPAPGEQKATVVFKVSDTKFTVNGVEQTMDVAPYVKNGRTYVPVRYSAQAVGVAAENILYSGGKVTLIKGDKVVQFTIGSNVMVINGVAVTMDVKAEVTNGRTMLPFRYVAQALGAQVNWDPTEQTVTMTL